VAVPELDLARIRAYGDGKVPAHVRDQIRIDVAVRGNSVSVFECRPPWHEGLTEWSRMPVAQLRYQPDKKLWALYWADRNGRWHPYPDFAPALHVQVLLDEIDRDPNAVFWG
jgi:Protein of unknown function (DUF3024)